MGDRQRVPGELATGDSSTAFSDTMNAADAGLAATGTASWALGATLGASELPRPLPGPAATGVEELSTQPQPSQRVGRYAILRQLGAGGMGVVYAAYDEELDRKVAIKLLRRAGRADSDRRARILREAQAMARISHPNVVQVYEVGEVAEAAAAGQVFIAMEFIEGTTLAEWQRQRSWEEVLPTYLAAGQGLLAAHESGLVHRDFKPDNVLLGADGRPRVADFGLARTRSSEPAPGAAPEASIGGASGMHSPGAASGSLLVSPLTQAGAILGTPAYMSPEQHRGEPTDSRCDQFSFCAALYEGLYQTPPFAGKTLAELRDNVLAGSLKPPPDKSTVPAKVYQALRRGLLSDPNRRFPSMRELLEALRFDPERDPAAAPRARRAFSRVIMGLGVVLLLTLGPAFRSGRLPKEFTALWPGIFIVALTIMGFFLRRTLLRNEFHRGTVFLLMLYNVEQLCLRVLALFIGISPEQLLPVEIVCMAGISATMAYFFFRAAWFSPPLLLATALWTALHPSSAHFVAMSVYPLCLLSLLMMWERAARARERQVHDRLCG